MKWELYGSGVSFEVIGVNGKNEMNCEEWNCGAWGSKWKRWNWGKRAGVDLEKYHIEVLSQIL